MQQSRCLPDWRLLGENTTNNQSHIKDFMQENQLFKIMCNNIHQNQIYDTLFSTPGSSVVIQNVFPLITG
ncbi:hypothetical protein DsansV1_C26g0195761 [Dioscorea sansibarensis]